MSPTEELVALNTAIRRAAILLAPHRDLMLRFKSERASADTLLPILDPTLWMNRERQQMADLLAPLYDAALELIDACETAQNRSIDIAVGRAGQ